MKTPLRDIVAVIVGRFHVARLHRGHRALFRRVRRRRHKLIMVILGDSYAMSNANALTFEMRCMMIQSTYPDQEFIFVRSASEHSSALRRSGLLDDLISATIPGREAIIYGSRDSIVHKYVGIYPKYEFDAVDSPSGTELRNAIEIRNTEDFRAGVIWTNVHQPGVYYPAVDVAPIKRSAGSVLLASWKEDEGKLRFAGSFFMPELDDSYEATAIRCLDKELPGTNVSMSQLVPMGSRRIIDPRYRRSKNGIVSLLMKASLDDLSDPHVGTGIDGMHLVEFDKVPEVIAEAHRPLAELMVNKWYW